MKLFVSNKQITEKMECKEVKSQLIFEIEESLSINEFRLLHDHLNDCPTCAAEYQFLKATFSTLDTTKKIEVKPYLYTRIKSRMKRNSVSPQKWVLNPIAIASVLVVGLLIGATLSKVTQSTIQKNISSDYDVAALFNDVNLETTEFHLLND